MIIKLFGFTITIEKHLLNSHREDESPTLTPLDPPIDGEVLWGEDTDSSSLPSQDENEYREEVRRYNKTGVRRDDNYWLRG